MCAVGTTERRILDDGHRSVFLAESHIGKRALHGSAAAFLPGAGAASFAGAARAASFAGAASSAAIATARPTLFPPTGNGLKAKRAAIAIAPGAKTAILRFLYTGVSKLDPFRVVLERRKVNFKPADAEGRDLTGTSTGFYALGHASKRGAQAIFGRGPLIFRRRRLYHGRWLRRLFENRSLHDAQAAHGSKAERLVDTFNKLGRAVLDFERPRRIDLQVKHRGRGLSR